MLKEKYRDRPLNHEIHRCKKLLEIKRMTKNYRKDWGAIFRQSEGRSRAVTQKRGGNKMPNLKTGREKDRTKSS